MSPRAIRRLVLLVVSVIAGVVALYLVPQPLPEISRGEFWDEVSAGVVRMSVVSFGPHCLLPPPTMTIRTP